MSQFTVREAPGEQSSKQWRLRHQPKPLTLEIRVEAKHIGDAVRIHHFEARRVHEADASPVDLQQPADNALARLQVSAVKSDG